MMKEIFFLSLMYGALGVSVHFQDCGYVGSYMIDEVFLHLPCKTQPCWLPLRKPSTATISFKSTDITALNITTEVNVMVANNRKRIEVSPLTCPKNLCPILKGEKKNYSIEINPNFHVEPIRVEIYWEAFNQKHEELFCVMFPVIIYNPDTHTSGGSFLV